MTGTIHHTICAVCGNQTVDSEGICHYAYCDEITYALNDIQPDPEWPDDEYENSLLMQDEDYSFDQPSEADYWDADDSHNE